MTTQDCSNCAFFVPDTMKHRSIRLNPSDPRMLGECHRRCPMARRPDDYTRNATHSFTSSLVFVPCRGKLLLESAGAPCLDRHDSR